MSRELPWVDGEGYVNSALVDGVTIDVRDIAAEGRAMYGEEGYAALVSGDGRSAPETDWRFTVHYPDGGRKTFHAGATAEHVGEAIRRDLAEREERDAVSREDDKP